MKTAPVLLLLLSLTAMRADPAREAESAPPDGAANAAGRRTVQHDGDVFELANSTTAPNVQTDEYILAGEKLAGWTQLVTVQRLTLTRPAGSDEFLSYFEKRVADDGASFEALKRTKSACVFAVRFPKSDHNDEQVMICLGFVDPAAPSRINIVQYAVKPHRVPLATVEARIRSWRDKFIRQASMRE